MASQQLIQYVKQQVQRGYQVAQIRDSLVRYGYNLGEVDAAITEALRVKVVRHVVHVTAPTIVAIVLIILSVVGLITFFAAPPTPKGPEKLMDLSLVSVTTNLQPGEIIEFILELENKGRLPKYDIFLRYELVDPRTNSIITFQEETKSADTKRSNVKIDLPQDAEPSKYILRALGRYDGEVATALLPIRVYQKVAGKVTCFDNIQNQDETSIDCGGVCGPCATCSDGILNQGETGVDCGGPCSACQQCPLSCNDFDPCTEDTCDDRTGYKCNHAVKSLCCGNGLCEVNENTDTCNDDCLFVEVPPSFAEQISEITDLSLTDESAARKKCGELDKALDQDRCYLVVSEITRSPKECVKIQDDKIRDDCYKGLTKDVDSNKICQLILKESRRDSCYMNFVTKGDYSVCDEIANKYLKQSCESLAQLQLIDEARQQ